MRQVFHPGKERAPWIGNDVSRARVEPGHVDVAPLDPVPDIFSGYAGGQGHGDARFAEGMAGNVLDASTDDFVFGTQALGCLDAVQKRR